MNTKKGGSLASNHVHRLLKGDCKKGGKRSRAKKSKSKKRKVVKKKTTFKTGKRSKSGKNMSKSRRKTKSSKMRGGNDCDIYTKEYCNKYCQPHDQQSPKCIKCCAQYHSLPFKSQVVGPSKYGK